MSPVAPGLMRVTGPTAFPSTGDFIAFRWNSGPRTIVPYLYNADGTPNGGALTSVVVAATVSAVLITHCKRTGNKAHVLAHVTRAGVADDSVVIYDVAGDTWTSEIDARPSGVNDIGRRWFTETGDALFYQAGTISGSFYLRSLSVDGLTDVTVGSASGSNHVYHISENTIGAFSSSSGVEITTGGSVTDPTAYDTSGVITNNQISFPPEVFIGERLHFSTIAPIPYRVDISGADLTNTVRASGWVPSGWKTAALNDNADAFSIFPFDQTASPPSESLDWITALPKTAQHGSSVEIRPVDYVSPGSPGTLAELPDAVFALGAGP